MKRLLAILLITVTLLCGCVKSEAVDLSDLTGKALGIMTASETDLFLSSNNTLGAKIVRYNDMPDMLMALAFSRVDALLMTEEFARQFVFSIETGYKFTASGLPEQDVSFGVSPKRVDLYERFNEFLTVYYKSNDYIDLKERAKKILTERIEYRKIPLTSVSGEIITISMLPTIEPYSFYEESTGEIVGIFPEIIALFANYADLRLNIVQADQQNAMLEIATDKSDMYIKPFATALTESYGQLNTLLLTNTVWSSELFFVTVDE